MALVAETVASEATTPSAVDLGGQPNAKPAILTASRRLGDLRPNSDIDHRTLFILGFSRLPGYAAKLFSPQLTRRPELGGQLAA